MQVLPLARLQTWCVFYGCRMPSAVPSSKPASGTPDAQLWTADLGFWITGHGMLNVTGALLGRRAAAGARRWRRAQGWRRARGFPASGADWRPVARRARRRLASRLIESPARTPHCRRGARTRPRGCRRSAAPSLAEATQAWRAVAGAARPAPRSARRRTG